VGRWVGRKARGKRQEARGSGIWRTGQRGGLSPAASPGVVAEGSIVHPLFEGGEEALWHDLATEAPSWATRSSMVALMQERSVARWRAAGCREGGGEGGGGSRAASPPAIIWPKECQKQRPNLPKEAALGPSPRYILKFIKTQVAIYSLTFLYILQAIIIITINFWKFSPLFLSFFVLVVGKLLRVYLMFDSNR